MIPGAWQLFLLLLVVEIVVYLLAIFGVHREVVD